MKQAKEIKVSIEKTAKVWLSAVIMTIYIEYSRGSSCKLFKWQESSKYARYNIRTQKSVPLYVWCIIRKNNRKKISFILAANTGRYLWIHWTKAVEVVLVWRSFFLEKTLAMKETMSKWSDSPCLEWKTRLYQQRCQSSLNYSLNSRQSHPNLKEYLLWNSNKLTTIRT